MYGLCDAENYWELTMETQPTNKLKKRLFPGDRFFFKMEKALQGVADTYVDNCFHANDAE